MMETNEFYQGYALALGFIAHAHGQESMVKDAMKEHGITLSDLVKAKCDEFDLAPIRKIFR